MYIGCIFAGEPKFSLLCGGVILQNHLIYPKSIHSSSTFVELTPAATFAWLFILGVHNINQGQVK